MRSLGVECRVWVRNETAGAVQRPTLLMAESLPQQSRSQGRPWGAASAGLPLDGGESEGSLRPTPSRLRTVLAS